MYFTNFWVLRGFRIRSNFALRKNHKIWKEKCMFEEMLERIVLHYKSSYHIDTR